MSRCRRRRPAFVTTQDDKWLASMNTTKEREGRAEFKYPK